MTFREERIGNCRLILGDCREVMPGLGKVDAVVTDPPYEDEAHRATRRVTGKNRGLVAGAFSFPSIAEIRDGIARQMVAVSDGWVLAFCMAEGVAPWRDALESAQAKYKRAMVWIKPDAMPQFNGQCPAAGFEMIVSAWCGQGFARWNGGGRHGTFTHCKNSGGKHLHETQKPLPLMLELVRLFSNDGDVVLDPFMGSGTTLVACAKLGRHGIGIEIDPGYFEIACRRVEQAYAQPDLFIEPPARPRQQELEIGP